MDILEIKDFDPIVSFSNIHSVHSGTIWDRFIYDFELVLIIEGELIFKYDNSQEIVFRAGDILLITPEQHHILYHTKNGPETIISCIHFEFLKGNLFSNKDYSLKREIPIKIETKGDPEIRQLFRKCFDTYSAFSSYKELLLSTILKEILIRVFEYSEGNKKEILSLRMNKMLYYIKKNYNKNITRKKISERFNLAPEYINALFKQELGITPTQYLHRERINRAYIFLSQEKLSVKEVAEKVGFYDQAHFSRTFKKILNISPSKV